MGRSGIRPYRAYGLFVGRSGIRPYRAYGFFVGRSGIRPYRAYGFRGTEGNPSLPGVVGSYLSRTWSWNGRERRLPGVGLGMPRWS